MFVRKSTLIWQNIKCTWWCKHTCVYTPTLNKSALLLLLFIFQKQASLFVSITVIPACVLYSGPSSCLCRNPQWILGLCRDVNQLLYDWSCLAEFCWIMNRVVNNGKLWRDCEMVQIQNYVNVVMLNVNNQQLMMLCVRGRLRLSGEAPLKRPLPVRAEVPRLAGRLILFSIPCCCINSCQVMSTLK